MLHEQTFILRRFATDRGEEGFVLFILLQLDLIGADHAGPEGREEFRFFAFLRVAFAEDGALEVEKLTVDGFEEGEEGGAVREFRVDTFFQHAKEFVEGAVERVVCALGAGGAEEGGEDFAHGCLHAGGAVFKDAGE